MHHVLLKVRVSSHYRLGGVRWRNQAIVYFWSIHYSRSWSWIRTIVRGLWQLSFFWTTSLMLVIIGAGWGFLITWINARLLLLFVLIFAWHWTQLLKISVFKIWESSSQHVIIVMVIMHAINSWVILCLHWVQI